MLAGAIDITKIPNTFVFGIGGGKVDSKSGNYVFRNIFRINL